MCFSAFVFLSQALTICMDYNCTKYVKIYLVAPNIIPLKTIIKTVFSNYMLYRKIWIVKTKTINMIPFLGDI